MSLALLGVAVVVLVVRGLLIARNVRRDHDGWAVAVAVAGAFVLVAVLVWLMDGAWQRRAERVRREHPDAWVRPMTVGRSMTLLYLDGSSIQLLGLRGRVRRRYARSDLAGADVGPIEFPAASRTGLRLRFHNGDQIDLLTMRRGGLASSEPDARSACDYLQHSR